MLRIKGIRDNRTPLTGPHYDNDHVGAVPEDLLSCFKVLKKFRNKFDCLVDEMLYIKQLTSSLNVQTKSIRAKYLCSHLRYVNLSYNSLNSHVVNFSFEPLIMASSVRRNVGKLYGLFLPLFIP